MGTTHMPEFRLDEASGLPVWLQLRNRLIYLIKTGYYRPGEQLPSVRSLAADLSINYNTVSKVYGSLEEDGYIVSKRRQGAFVADVSERCDVSVSAVSEGLAREYLKRCLEVGMTLDDAERQILKTIKEQRDAQAGGEPAKGGVRFVRFDDADCGHASRGA